ncbi:hypothetical protein ACJQWK_08803 [Exserohilum turcicum]|uniref:Heterokaryon incompatibility domain-containing protein n=1 Tax=Exserohilum turcicum (strain 28A) TaxID=671987 RepID=R0KED7_EXST2|nr:uncharacterized protein SETTUDRAFT_178596 [Exserohilum turcica Et28A]EOA86522.1 hypothetical protein SETTUDRAFT_178596 [Exserohilum turcica Et28A]
MSGMLRNFSHGLWDQYPIGTRLDSAFLSRRQNQVWSAISNAVMLFWSLFYNLGRIWPVLAKPLLVTNVNTELRKHIPPGSRAAKIMYIAVAYPLGYTLVAMALLLIIPTFIAVIVVLPIFAVLVLGLWAICVVALFLLWLTLYRYPVFELIYPRLRRRILLNNSHVYSGLPRDAPSIRILRLKPGTKSEKIQCELIEGPLSELQFEALSYVWGVTMVPYTISVNERSFYVTYNLYSALQELRYPDRERQLWIDAVCINQNDNTEKSSQVQMMRDIYAKASKVVVWLGKSTRATSHAFEFIRQFGIADDDTTDVLWNDLIIRPNWKKIRAEYVRICYCEWWSRAWIIQEVVVGQHVVMQRGSHQVEWAAVHKLFTYRPFGNDEFGDHEAPWFVKNVEDLRKAVGSAEGPGMTLGDLVCRFRFQSATFGSDKVYALLGLLRPDDPSLMTPDYSKTPDDVFLQFTESYLLHNGNLDILSLAPGAELQSVSWCRDWRLNHDGSFNVCGLSSLQPPRLFSSSESHRPVFEVDSERRILSLQGYRADVVARTGDFHSSSSTMGVDWDLVFRSWERVAGENLSNADTSASRMSFNRTVTADCWQTEPLDWRKRIVPRQRRRRNEEDAYRLAIEDACSNRRFFVTTKGRFGLGPWNMQKGDVVGILLGGKTPFVLRGCGSKSLSRHNSMGYHRLIGEAFVEGLMYRTGSLEADNNMGRFHLL